MTIFQNVIFYLIVNHVKNHFIESFKNLKFKILLSFVFNHTNFDRRRNFRLDSIYFRKVSRQNDFSIVQHFDEKVFF